MMLSDAGRTFHRQNKRLYQVQTVFSLYVVRAPAVFDHVLWVRHPVWHVTGSAA